MFQLYISLITASILAKSAPFCIISLPTSPCLRVVFCFPLTVKSVMQGSVLAPSMYRLSLHSVAFLICPSLYLSPKLMERELNKFSFHFIHYLDQFRIFSQLFLYSKNITRYIFLKSQDKMRYTLVFLLSFILFFHSYRLYVCPLSGTKYNLTLWETCQNMFIILEIVLI